MYDQNLLNITLNKLCGVINKLGNKFKYKRSSFRSSISAVIEANKITPTTDLATNAKKNSLWSHLQSANTPDEPKLDLHWSYIPAKNKIEHLSIKLKKNRQSLKLYQSPFTAVAIRLIFTWSIERLQLGGNKWKLVFFLS